MFQPADIARFQEDGFLRGPQVLSAAEVEELRGELDRVIADHGRPGRPQPMQLVNLTGKADAPVWQVVNIWQASEAFRRLVHHPAIARGAAQLLGASELRIWHDQVQYKPKAQGGVNMWHQDSPYWPALQPKDQQITAWVALDDANADNGCMSMVPGSHQWGNQIEFLHTLKAFDAMPSQFAEHPIQVRLAPVPCGAVHFHHSLTWHGSHANTSQRPRRALAIHFMSGQTRYHAAGSHVMKRLIQVADGEVLSGDTFPLVWSAALVNSAR